MAGPSDISAILSQAGRIEKINQNPFVQSEVARQILTEDEARQRLQKNREVNESKKAQDIVTREREQDNARRGKKERDSAGGQVASEADSPDSPRKHIIDVVI